MVGWWEQEEESFIANAEPRPKCKPQTLLSTLIHLIWVALVILILFFIFFMATININRLCMQSILSKTILIRAVSQKYSKMWFYWLIQKFRLERKLPEWNQFQGGYKLLLPHNLFAPCFWFLTILFVTAYPTAMRPPLHISATHTWHMGWGGIIGGRWSLYSTCTCTCNKNYKLHVYKNTGTCREVVTHGDTWQQVSLTPRDTPPTIWKRK